MSVVVEGDRLYMLALFRDGIEVYRHAAHLAVAVFFSRLGEYLLGVGVALAPDAEHVLFISVEVALSEAAPRKRLFEQLHLLAGGLAALLERL